MSEATNQSIVQRMLHRLGDAQWKQHAQKLVGASLLAQLINLVFIPVLTRIYPPDDYAVLATLMAATVIGSLVAALGYDYAVPIVEDDDQALSLTQAGAYSAVALAAAIGIAASFASPDLLVPILGERLAAIAPWTVALIILGSSLSTTLDALQIRHRRMNVIGWSRVAQACVATGVPIGLGLAGAGATGLVLGYGLSLFTPAAIHLGHLYLTGNLRLNGWGKVRRAGSAHRKYMHFTAPEALFNALSVHGPIMIMSYLGRDPVVAAHINLGLRLLQAPSFLVAKIGSQLVQGSIRDWHVNGQVASYGRKIAIGLSAAGLAAGIPVALLAPPLAGPFLGAEWAGIGWVIAFLVPGVVLHMISFPLIPVSYLRGQNARLMSLTVAAAIVRNGLCVAALPFGGWAIAAAFCGGAVLHYAVLTAYLFRLSCAIPEMDNDDRK